MYTRNPFGNEERRSRTLVKTSTGETQCAAGEVKKQFPLDEFMGARD